MIGRAHLFNRRAATTIEIEHEGAPLTLTIGQYPDGGAGEVFVHLGNKRHSTPIEALARDAAILISIAIQHGTPLGVMQRAVTRNTMTSEDEQAAGKFGDPASLIGSVLDGMVRKP